MEEEKAIQKLIEGEDSENSSDSEGMMKNKSKKVKVTENDIISRLK